MQHPATDNHADWVGGAPRRDHILPDDFLLFFDGDKETAHDAFDYFDRNKDGSISCSELQVRPQLCSADQPELSMEAC